MPDMQIYQNGVIQNVSICCYQKSGNLLKYHAHSLFCENPFISNCNCFKSQFFYNIGKIAYYTKLLEKSNYQKICVGRSV